MTITALSDDQLLEQVRQGDEAAFTELYVRHQPAALRLARTYRRWADPDDLVNGAFERAAGALRRGAGPDGWFRAYVFVTLRQLAVERHIAAAEAAAAGAGEPGVESGGAAGGAEPAALAIAPVPAAIAGIAGEDGGPEMGPAERQLIGGAFDRLPDRWQVVLWHTAVEGHGPAALAEALGVTEAAATAMRNRARELFRQACLDGDRLPGAEGDHEPYRSHLGAHARGTLPAPERAAADGHLHRCEECRAVAASLADADRTVARAVLPLFLLVGGGTMGVDPASSATAPGGLLARLRHVAPAVGSTAAIAAVLGGIVGMGALVGREHAGPLDSTADAADIGAGPDGVDGEAWNGGAGSRDRGGRTLFGEDDFALSPFDDDPRDLGDFGDRFDLAGRRTLGGGRPGFGGAFGAGPGSHTRSSVAQPPSTAPPRTTPPSSRPPSSPPPPPPPPSAPPPSSPPPTSPPPTSPPPTTPPPTTPPPTSPPPTTPPPTTPPPAPAPLTFAGASWQPTGVGTGTVSFTIGEAGGATSSGDAAAAAGSLVLRVTLGGPATFADSGLPAGCRLAGATTAECAFDQPPAGGTVPPVALPVVVGGTGASASGEILRDGAVEATLSAPVALTPFEAGLSVAYPAAPWSATAAGGGMLRVTVAQAEGWAVDGLTVTVALTDGARLDGGGTPGCAEVATGSGHGVACPVPTVPGGGSVEVVIPLTIAGEGQQAVNLTLADGATVLATVDQAVALTVP